ncbi:hypothetical protein J0H58_27470 [bacterium]|nr:hypothetical protein [bacterium]
MSDRSRAWLLALVRPAAHAVAYYPLLLPIPVLLVALAWGGVAAGYDAFHVLWDESPAVGWAAGVGVASILGGAVLFVFLLDQGGETPPAKPLTAQSADAPADPPVWVGYWATWVVLLLLVGAPALGWQLGSDLHPFRPNPLPAYEPENGGASVELPADPDPAAAAVMAWCRVGFPLGLLTAAAGYPAAFWYWRRAVKKAAARPEDLAFWLLLALAVGYVGMLALHWAVPDLYVPFLPAAVSALLLLGFLEVLAGRAIALGYQRRWWLAPAVLGVVAVPVFFPACQTEYQLPNLADYYRAPVALAGYDDRRPGGKDEKDAAPPAGVGKLVPDREALDNWNKRVAERYGGPRPLVVVSVSGGASASALYTADVLFTLEAKHPGFADQVRVVSGASGGMLGAAYFVTANRPDTPLGKERTKYTAALTALGSDFLGPIVQKWVHKDFPLALVPTGTADGRGVANDRGRALERAWSAHLGGRLDVPLADLREEERRGEIPSLVFTPMTIEDGRQLVVSNLDLDYLADATLGREVNAVAPPSRPQTGTPSHPAVEFYRLFPGATKFTVATAVRMSASFPFFSPSAAVPTRPLRHLVDAGYYDNYGTFTATRWVMEQARWLNGDADAKATGWRAKFEGTGIDPEVVLLQVRCFGFERETREYVRADERDGRDPRERLLDAAAPVHGLLAVRRAHMIYRGDERVDGTRALLARRDGLAASEEPVGFRRVWIECAVEPSLNWALTPDTRARLRTDVHHQLAGGGATRAAVRSFLAALREVRYAEGLDPRP